MKGHDQVVNFAAFSPDGKRVVTASDDNTARIWDTDAPIVLSEKKWVNAAAFSPDGTRVVTAPRNATVDIWDAETGKGLLHMGGSDNPNVFFASYSPDGSRIVTASDDSEARIWDARSGALIVTVTLGHPSEVYSTVFSRDGERIVTASEDGAACVWDASSGVKLRCLEDTAEGNSAVHYAAFSPDGASRCRGLCERDSSRMGRQHRRTTQRI
jgi:WD40 repeat protein